MAAMREAGVSDRDIYLDKRSGADFERQGYRQLLRRLRAGDTLIVKSIDRLGRNYDEILEQWRIITREKCASILVLDMPLLDTRQNRDLTGTLIADIVLQLLSYVAQTEREFIRQRQAEGIAAAKARGVHFGRQALPVPEIFPEIVTAWLGRQLSSRAAGKSSAFRRRLSSNGASSGNKRMEQNPYVVKQPIKKHRKAVNTSRLFFSPENRQVSGKKAPVPTPPSLYLRRKEKSAFARDAFRRKHKFIRI